MIKKVILIFYRSILGFLEFFMAFVSFYLVFFSICALIEVGDTAPDEGIGVYVKTNGVHTDICLPVETEVIDWKEFIPIKDFPSLSKFEYVSMGWGDKGFFLDTPEWSDLTLKTALNAAILPSGTAMHVAYLENVPVINESCKYVIMDEKKYPDLIEYVKNSFKLENGLVDLIPNSGYWNNDNFYEAHGNYHLFKTCNIWTNGALKVAGIKTAFYGLFSDGIMRHLD